jgi:hypothetical protein
MNIRNVIKNRHLTWQWWYQNSQSVLHQLANQDMTLAQQANCATGKLSTKFNSNV